MTAAERPLASQARVLLMAGSPSDLDWILEAQETLESLEIPSTIRIASAHRTPEMVAEVVGNAERDGFQVIIAFAGLAAHLAGVAAAYTLLPVIAVPRAVGALGGIDAALASLQMPPGTPVAAVSIDGARNGALLAARILALSQPELQERLRQLAARQRERYAPERIEAEIKERKRARREDPS